MTCTVAAMPDLASGDVVGRVFVQNAVLPVLAYVGGPTELAYLAQVRAAHQATGDRFPLAVPRPQATWVEPKVAKAVEAFGLTVADAIAGRIPAAPPPNVPEAGGDDPATTQLAATRAMLVASAERMEALPAVARALREGVEAIDRALNDLADEREERSGRGRARWEKALASLRPGGQPQERVLSPLSLTARYGVDALREGLSLLDPLADGHQVLFLE